jgi:hypothetical protein
MGSCDTQRLDRRPPWHVRCGPFRAPGGAHGMIRPTLRIRAVLVSFRSAARDVASSRDPRGLQVVRLRGLALLDEIEAQIALADDERRLLEEARTEIRALVPVSGPGGSVVPAGPG